MRTHRRVRPSRMLAVAALTVAVFGGTAIAQGGPKVTEVFAAFQADPITDNPIQCEGENGTYLQDAFRLRGSETASDPRLSGNLSARVKSLINLDTGDGVTFGSVKIRNGGVTTAQAFFAAAIRDLNQIKGTLFFELKGREFALANFSAIQDLQTNHIQGEFGADPALVPADQSILFNGQTCTSDFWQDFPTGLLRVTG